MDDAPPPGSGPSPEGLPEPEDADAAAIRRLVEEGAGTPEAIRELAARLRAQREREEAQWRREVKPSLKKARRRLGGAAELPLPAPPPSPWAEVPPAAPAAPDGPPMPPPPPPPGSAVPPPAPAAPPSAPPGAPGAVEAGPVAAAGAPRGTIVLAVLAVVAVAIVAVNTTIWLLLVPLAALLAWAWREGRRDSSP